MAGSGPEDDRSLERWIHSTEDFARLRYWRSLILDQRRRAELDDAARQVTGISGPTPVPKLCPSVDEGGERDGTVVMPGRVRDGTRLAR